MYGENFLRNDGIVLMVVMAVLMRAVSVGGLLLRAVSVGRLLFTPRGWPRGSTTILVLATCVII